MYQKSRYSNRKNANKEYRLRKDQKIIRSKKPKVPKLVFYGKHSEEIYEVPRNLYDSNWIIWARISEGIELDYDYIRRNEQNIRADWPFIDQKMDAVFKHAIYKGNFFALCELSMRLCDGGYIDCSQEVSHMTYQRFKNDTDVKKRLFCRRIFVYIQSKYRHMWLSDEIQDIKFEILHELNKQGDCWGKEFFAKELMSIMDMCDTYYLHKSLFNDTSKGFKYCWEQSFQIYSELIACNHNIDTNTYNITVCIYNFLTLTGYQLLKSARFVNEKFEDLYIQYLVHWIHTGYGNKSFGRQYSRLWQEGPQLTIFDLMNHWVLWGSKNINEYPLPIQHEMLYTELSLRRNKVSKDIRLMIRKHITTPRNEYPIVFKTEEEFDRFCKVLELQWKLSSALKRILKTKNQGLRKSERILGISFGDIYGILLWDNIRQEVLFRN